MNHLSAVFRTQMIFSLKIEFPRIATEYPIKKLLQAQSAY